MGKWIVFWYDMLNGKGGVITTESQNDANDLVRILRGPDLHFIIIKGCGI